MPRHRNARKKIILSPLTNKLKRNEHILEINSVFLCAPGAKKINATEARKCTEKSNTVPAYK